MKEEKDRKTRELALQRVAKARETAAKARQMMAELDLNRPEDMLRKNLDKSDQSKQSYRTTKSQGKDNRPPQSTKRETDDKITVMRQTKQTGLDKRPA